MRSPLALFGSIVLTFVVSFGSLEAQSNECGWCNYRCTGPGGTGTCWFECGVIFTGVICEPDYPGNDTCEECVQPEEQSRIDVEVADDFGIELRTGAGSDLLAAVPSDWLELWIKSIGREMSSGHFVVPNSCASQYIAWSDEDGSLATYALKP